MGELVTGLRGQLWHRVPEVRKQRLNDVRVKGADESRSLTLVEEERLQGLPDGHTERENIPPGADAAHRERPAYPGSPLLHASGDASREDRSPTFGIQAATTQTYATVRDGGEEEKRGIVQAKDLKHEEGPEAVHRDLRNAN